MNKKLFLLPLMAFLLVGCDQPGEGGGTGGGGGGGGGGGQVTENDGSLAHPYFASEAIDLCKAAGEGKIVGPNKELYVTGTFDAGTTVNAQYKQFYGSLDGTEFKISGAALAEGLTATVADGALDGCTVVVKGYIELYQGEYKMGYLPATASPTGNKYVPTIVSIDGQSSGGGSGEGGGGGSGEGGGGGGGQSTVTSSYGVKGTIDTSATTVAYDFAAAKSSCPAYSESDKDVVKDVTISGASFKAVNCYNSENVNYWMFGSKKYASHSWAASQTAVSGKIVGVRIVIPKGASGNTRFHFGFGTSAMNAAFLTGDAIKPTEGSQSSLSADVTLDIVPNEAGDFKYFNITSEFIEKNQFNGSATTVTVFYK